MLLHNQDWAASFFDQRMAHAAHNGAPERTQATCTDNDNIRIDLIGDAQYTFVSPAINNDPSCNGYIWRCDKAAYLLYRAINDILGTSPLFVTEVLQGLLWSGC